MFTSINIQMNVTKYFGTDYIAYPVAGTCLASTSQVTFACHSTAVTWTLKCKLGLGGPHGGKYIGSNVIIVLRVQFYIDCLSHVHLYICPLLFSSFCKKYTFIYFV